MDTTEHTHSCGYRFSPIEWAGLRSRGNQLSIDPDRPMLTYVDQLVDCPRCSSTIVAAQVQVVKQVFGPVEKLVEIVETEAKLLQLKAASALANMMEVRRHSVVSR